MNTPGLQHQRILIVEDDETIAALVEQGLTRWGFTARRVEDFINVLDAFAAVSPSLVLLDISLPFYNGYYWCSRIRETSNVPIVFLSSANEDMDIVMAMQMGGDDYITKPFSMAVLIAKIQAILRRSAEEALPTEYRFGNARLNMGDGCLYAGEERVELTKNEFRILHQLLQSRGRTVSREEIMQKLWDSDSFIDDNTLTVNINRLRRKLGALGLTELIVTKRGEGYLIHDP